jgi:hypothetical protein
VTGAGKLTPKNQFPYTGDVFALDRGLLMGDPNSFEPNKPIKPNELNEIKQKTR